MQDVIILQSESKMKAALGIKVRVSLPKAFQTNKVQTKSLAIEGVPTDIMDTEFLEFLDLNKINYAKAERLKSKKDSRVLPVFRLEINDPTEAEALLSQNLVCPNNRHNLLGGGISANSFGHPVLQLPKFQTKMSDLRWRPFPQRMPK